MNSDNKNWSHYVLCSHGATWESQNLPCPSLPPPRSGISVLLCPSLLSSLLSLWGQRMTLAHLSTSAVLQWGQFCLQGVMWQCLGTFRVVTTGGGTCFWHLVRPEILLNILQNRGWSHLGEGPSPKGQQYQHCKTFLYHAQHRWLLPLRSNNKQDSPGLAYTTRYVPGSLLTVLYTVGTDPNVSAKMLCPGELKELAHVPVDPGSKTK